MTKASDNEFPSVLFGELASKPTTPAAGKWRVYAKADGLYYVDDAGTETGPLAAATSAPAVVAARYTTNAGQTIATTATDILNFEDKVYDTDNAVTTGAAWKFTAPSTGYYHVDVAILTASSTAWETTEIVIIYLYIDGSLNCELYRHRMQTTANPFLISLSGSIDIYLAEDSYFDIRLFQNSDSDLSLYTTGECWVNVHKI